jgi:adenylate cyclase
LSQSRQLAAIMFTDIVGYTALMEQDEKKAFDVLKKNLAIHQSVISEFRGRLIKEMGDGMLASFSTVSDALNAAIQIQKQCHDTSEYKLSIGIHQGEVVFQNGDVFGDAVNVASRIQTLGSAGSILFSKKITDELKNKAEFQIVSLGNFEFKNVNESIEVFALANDGFPVPRRNKIQGKLKKSSLNRNVIIAVSLIGLMISSLFIFKDFLFKNNRVEDFDKSIAVLPFDDLSNTGDQEWFSDGLSEEILNSLAQFSDLKVTARTSSFYFKGKDATIPEIAEKLGVVYVLEGSVRKIEDKLRITAQLIRASDGFHLWSQTFDRSTKDLFKVQEEIAQGIARELIGKISAINQPQPGIPTDQAYKFYLKGRYFWDKRTPESYDSAEAYYHRAIELDPNYALAYVGLADCYTFQNQRKGLTRLELVPIAHDYIQKALSIDNNLPEALTTQAFIQSHFEWDWQGSQPIFQKAIGLKPNYPSAHLYYGNVLFATGDIKQGILETKKALELDPLSASLNWVLGRNYFFAGEYDLAITQLKKTQAIQDYHYAKIYLGLCYLQKKQYKEALDILNEHLKVKNKATEEPVLVIIMTYVLKGEKEKAESELVKFLKDNGDPNPYYLSALYVSMGNLDDAMKELEKGYERRIIHMMHLKVNPLFDPIRKDPRFIALMKKMNFV